MQHKLDNLDKYEPYQKYSVQAFCLLSLSCLCDFSVVEFASYSDMKRAIEKLDGTEINGRKIKLTEDRSRRRGGRRFVYMKGIARKPVFRVSDQVLHKPGCVATGDD